jgi:hypothetical protein
MSGFQIAIHPANTLRKTISINAHVITEEEHTLRSHVLVLSRPPHRQTENILPRIMPDDVKVKLAPRDGVEVQFGGQNATTTR